MSVVEQRIPTGTWRADVLHSSVRFEVEHLGVSTFGAGFTEFEAGLVAGPDGTTLWGAVQVESLDIRDDALRPHVMSADFLDVARFPKLAFQSGSLSQHDGELVVQGELTIRGQTAAVEARGRISEPIVDPFGNERLALSLDTVIDRAEFGIGWQMALPDGGPALAMQVKLAVSLEFVKET